MRGGEGHLFVTGRAGTGKSTLLRALRDMSEEDMAIAGADGPRRGQRRRPDHPFLLRLAAAPHPPRGHPPRPQRRGHAAPEAARHRRGLHGPLGSDVGHRPIATRQPRPRPRSPSAACGCSVRRFASVAAGHPGSRGGVAPRIRVRRAVLLLCRRRCARAPEHRCSS